MKHEVRAIPPAPRRIRLRPLFAHRWPLLAAGALFTVTGLLLAWLMFLQSGGKMSQGPRLDTEPRKMVTGKVTKVSEPRAINGALREEVSFAFAYHTPNQMGISFHPAGTWHVGDIVDVEVLISDPNVARIPGGMMHLDYAWLRARFWILALATPGILLLTAWAAGAFQLRLVLAHGDVAVGTIHRIRSVPLLLPEMLAVDYTFRDHHATRRHNCHWVRVHGALGARLREQLETGTFEEMPVLHHRRLPQWNRMVLPEDFLASPPPIVLLENDAT